MIHSALLMAYGILVTCFLILLLRGILDFFGRKHESRTAWAAVGVSLSGLLLFSFGVLDPFVSFSDGWIGFWPIAFWVSGVLGFVACIRSRTPQKIDKQSKQSPAGTGGGSAFLAVAAVLVMGASPVVITENMLYKQPVAQQAITIGPLQPGDEEKKVHAFEEYNLQFDAPDSPWIEFNMKKYNPATLAGFFRLNPPLYLQIVAERGIPVGDNLEEIFAEHVYGQAALAMESHKLIEKKAYPVNGIQGFLFQSKHKLSGQPVDRLHWLGGKNGFYYQIVAWTNDANGLGQMRGEFDRFAAAFRQIRPDEQAGQKEFTEDYVSNRYHYKIRSADSGWHQWWLPVEPGIHLADFKMLQGNSRIFLVFPVIFWETPPPLDVFAAAVLKINKIEIHDVPNKQIQKIKDGEAEGYLIDFEQTLDGRKYDYHLKIVLGKSGGYFVTAYQMEGFDRMDHEALKQAVTLFERLPEGAFPAKSDLNPEEKERHIFVYTTIGNQLLQSIRERQGLAYLKAAYELDPEQSAQLVEVLDGYQHLGLNDEALRYLNKHIKNFPEDKRLQRRFAYLSYQVGDLKSAAETYRKLLEAGETDSELMADYRFVMEELGEAEEADRNLIRWLSGKGTLEGQKALAVLLEENGKTQESLDLFKSLYEKHPMNEGVRSEYLNTLLAHERYEEALAVTESHLQEHGSAPDVHIYQGFIFAALKKYSESRAALASARTAAANPALESFITGIQAIEEQQEGRDPAWARAEIKRHALVEDDEVFMQEKITYQGDWAQEMRNNVLNMGEKSWIRQVSDFLENYFGSIEIEKAFLSQLEFPGEPIIFQVNYRLKEHFTKIQEKAMAILPALWEADLLYPKDKGQAAYAFRLVFPGRISVHSTIETPQDKAMSHNIVPEYLNYSGFCLQAQGSIEPTAAGFTVRQQASLVGGGYSLKEYKRCREEIADYLKKNAIVLLRESLPSGSPS